MIGHDGGGAAQSAIQIAGRTGSRLHDAETSLEDVFIQLMGAAQDNMTMIGLFSLRRLATMIVKEVIQMRRDRITFAMMLGVPLMQLLLFGFAINNDPKGLPAALVAPTQDRFTRAMVSALETDRLLPLHPSRCLGRRGRIPDGARRCQLSWSRCRRISGARVVRGDHPQILIEADATDPAVASGAISTLGTVAADALLRETGAEATAAARAAPQLNVVVHRRYNPEGITQYNIVPGLSGGHPADDHGDDDLDGADARDRAGHDGKPAVDARSRRSRSCWARCCPIFFVGAVQVLGGAGRGTADLSTCRSWAVWPCCWAGCSCS